ncbi:MAG: class 1 fructose-bisphosphatase [Acidobacteriota bacterium]
MVHEAMTLSRFLQREVEGRPRPDPATSAVLSDMARAGKTIAHEMRRAALVGLLGLSDETNPSGEEQKKLDVVANDIVLEVFGKTGEVAGIVSEEIEEIRPMSSGPDARYILCVDPLDGSSNTDINCPVGTIFGFYERAGRGACGPIGEELGGGMRQAVAGYVMYGPSTILVYTRGNGVNGFTFEHDLDDFVLSHRMMRCPRRGRTFSANVGRSHDWGANVRRYVDYLTQRDPSTKRPYSLRYVGALVADVHRTLIEGGIFFYPADRSNRSGKLRLLYECAPMAYVVEQAGGRAGTGRQRILDQRVESLHQRVELVIGSPEDVALYEKFLAGGGV